MQWAPMTARCWTSWRKRSGRSAARSNGAENDGPVRGPADLHFGGFLFSGAHGAGAGGTSAERNSDTARARLEHTAGGGCPVGGAPIARAGRLVRGAGVLHPEFPVAGGGGW